MSARIEVHYKGNVYKGNIDIDSTPEQLKDMIYENLSKTEKLALELESGGYLILGYEAVKTAAILVVET